MRYRSWLPVLALAVGLIFISGGVFSQEDDAEADGCCWVHFYEQGGFEGEDDRRDGPGEWADLAEDVGSLRCGACANATVWQNEDYDGESVTLLPGEARSSFDWGKVGSMKITCD
jgi:hypothetical protein